MVAWHKKSLFYKRSTLLMDVRSFASIYASEPKCHQLLIACHVGQQGLTSLERHAPHCNTSAHSSKVHLLYLQATNYRCVAIANISFVLMDFWAGSPRLCVISRF